MKAGFCITLASLVLLLTGCGTGRYAEDFSTPSDAFKIESIVYEYLLQRYWDPQQFAAIFLSGSDEEVAALIQRFPNHTPPLKPSKRAQVQANRTPIDKDTGKRAVILSVEAGEPEGEKAAAVGRWYAGPLTSGAFVFSLKKSGNEWVIESVK